ncbi:class I SAM-dependent methyltransferase family protein [uncultured Methanobrevibacter sp.]|uniref:class I SAM-dependent methyltransferase n=1 Tax=uncultured Methanobrevibacter sp. TaxID=253161 RepID=UPI00261CD36A|nr:class I SAM-dependent methyltransferase family protein [uncultured Methanobrevibacter sp.]
MKSIKVPLKELNNTRKKLMEKQLMNMDYKIKTQNEYGFIPINSTEFESEYEIVDTTLEPIKRYPKNITELLKNDLSSKEIEDLKTSFDIIGDIVIVEIPQNLEDKKSKIGQATLDFTKRKSVYMKKSAIHGTIRIRDLELIAGENNPITIHKEHGTRLKLNVKEVYFSPRLATERKRVSDSVRENENILDMFCGIGPFPIVIAKNNNVKITAVDINENAIKYLNENIRLNKLHNIKTICGDINEVSKHLNEKFDRIIMNLPGLAYEFLDLAMKLISDNGIINYYEFSDSYGQGIERLQKAAKKENKKIEILNTRKVKSSSPGMWHIAIDAKVTS